MEGLLTGLGLAFPAGLNAYIPLLIVGLTARFSNLITLEAPYDFLSSNAGLTLLSLLLAIEVVADKIAIVDHINDILQTIIRPAAGAILMLASTSAVSDIHPALLVALGLIAAGTVHAAKATTRPAVTATTGGLGNPVVSTAEDAAAIALSIAAILAPILALALVALLVVLVVITIRRYRRRRRLSAAQES